MHRGVTRTAARGIGQSVVYPQSAAEFHHAKHSGEKHGHANRKLSQRRSSFVLATILNAQHGCSSSKRWLCEQVMHRHSKFYVDHSSRRTKWLFTLPAARSGGGGCVFIEGAALRQGRHSRGTALIFDGHVISGKSGQDWRTGTGSVAVNNEVLGI